MAFLKFLLTMGIVAAGFFIGGNFTKETEGAVIGAGLGLIVALILVNFWRAILKLAFAAGVLGLIALAVYSYTELPGWRPPDSREESNPSNEEIIRAVHDYLGGKTYNEEVTTYESIQISCTQLDHDLGRECNDSDLYPPYGHRIVSNPVTKTSPQDCPSPLPISNPPWQVAKLAEGRWEVSNTQGQWIVEKMGSELQITAQQKC